MAGTDIKGDYYSYKTDRHSEMEYTYIDNWDNRKFW